MILGFDKRYIWALFPLLGLSIGHYLDRKETERMVMFRDKSALFGRPDCPEKEPSW